MAAGLTADLTATPDLPLRHESGVSPPSPARLTRCEYEVLGLVLQDLTSRQIATRLFVSVRTVNFHRNHILSKTGCANFLEMVSRFGVVMLDPDLLPAPDGAPS